MHSVDACMTHIARLIPEYCGATFEEAISFRPTLLVLTESTETGERIPNIWRCSLE